MKDIPFYSIYTAITDDTHFLSKLGCFRICSPTRYYTCFPLYKGFCVLIFSNVSLWLFAVFRWLLFCLLLLGVWSNEGDIEFSSSLGPVYPGILQWDELQMNSSVEFWNPVDGSVWFSCFYRFFNCYKIFCVVVSFMSIYLLNW